MFVNFYIKHLFNCFFNTLNPRVTKLFNLYVNICFPCLQSHHRQAELRGQAELCSQAELRGQAALLPPELPPALVVVVVLVLVVLALVLVLVLALWTGFS